MATTYITRTPASNGSDTKFTFSTWVKRGIVSAGQEFLFDYYSGGYDQFYFAFNGNDTLAWQSYNGGSGPSNTSGETVRRFRDSSSWYHIVLAVDTTLASSGDRIRLYVNGVEETAFTSENQPAQDTALAVNQTTETLYIGAEPPTPSGYFTGEMSHVQWVDGTQLTPTEFGQVDSTSGIWKIKTGCYATPGTNGFCMKMEDRTNLDLDSSSNAHTFVTSGTGLTATYDNPSNNFCTFNPLVLFTSNNNTFTNGNTTVTQGGSAWRTSAGTMAANKGKWYWEMETPTTGGSVHLYPGIATVPFFDNAGATNEGGTATVAQTDVQVYCSRQSDGDFHRNNGSTSDTTTSWTGLSAWTTGDIIGVRMNLDDQTFSLAINNSWADDQTIIANEWFQPSIAAYSSGAIEFNFGNGYFGPTLIGSPSADEAGYGAFKYAPPTGYYSLCTNNLKTYGG